MPNKFIPFLRVSTKQQDTDRQLADITTYATSNGWQLEPPIAETVSGGKKNEARAGIQAVLKLARKGDTIITTEISRIGRNTVQVLLFLEELADRGVSVRVLNLNLATLNAVGTRDAMAWAMLQVGAVFGELERAGIRERVQSGVDYARTQGRVGGRPAGSGKPDEVLLQSYPQLVKLLVDKSKKLSIRELAKLTGTADKTVQKVRKVFLAQQAAESVAPA